ncbi:MAG: MFS transporter [Solirubrobacteraceae bacterium]
MRLLNANNRRWWTLLGVTFAIFMTTLDNTVVNVALPSIQRDLGIGNSGLEWVVNAYILAFATLMLTGGRLADALGRRRLFLTGITLFTSASLLGGFATGEAMLIVARAMQGVGAALMTPTTLAIISVAFPDTRERARAIGLWAATSALAFAIGPVTGGLLAQHVRWSWIFWINVPVGVVGWLIGRNAIDESRGETGTRSVDLAGLATSGVMLLALVYALIEGNSYGWTSPLIVGLLTTAAVAFLAFLAIESRARAPMLDLSLFRDRTFAGANVLLVLSGFGIFGVYFFLSLYVQGILGFTPTKAGLVFVPMALLMTLIAPASNSIAARIGVGPTIAAGMLLASFGFIVLEHVGQAASFTQLVPGVLIIGSGAGLTTPLTATVLSAIPAEKSGVASGVLNTVRELAASLGIAITGAMLAARETSAISSGATHAAGFVDGYHIGHYVSAGVMAAGAAVALAVLRGNARQRLVPAAEAV